jgi:hypothetical protein
VRRPCLAHEGAGRCEYLVSIHSWSKPPHHVKVIHSGRRIVLKKIAALEKLRSLLVDWTLHRNGFLAPILAYLELLLNRKEFRRFIHQVKIAVRTTTDTMKVVTAIQDD